MKGLNPSQGTVPKPHALTKAGGYTYQYDANGNLTSGKNKTLSYDIENRLLEVNELGIITTFQYDGDGGRVTKVTRNQSTETRRPRHFPNQSEQCPSLKIDISVQYGLETFSRLA